MDKFKGRITKIILSGILIFTFGIFVGYQLNYGAISSIQGYLFNAIGDAFDTDASDANASDANASDANASDANASDANASDANASDANACAVDSRDNIIYLDYFAISTETAKVGERVSIVIDTEGACNSGASIAFKNVQTGTTFNTTVENMTDEPSIVIPKNVEPGTYEVTDILLTGVNSDTSTFTKHYTANGENAFYFDNQLVVEKNEIATDNEVKKEELVLKHIDFDSSSVQVNDKVYLTINTSLKILSLKLELISDNNQKMSVYVNGLNKNPYFEIPANTPEGTYTLVGAILTGEESSATYTKNGENNTLKYAFNSSIEVTGIEESKFVYNNEDITSEIISKLYRADDGTEIIINADTSTMIDKELFNVIKGRNKQLLINYQDVQMIFNGQDIAVAKTIDARATIEQLKEGSNISELVDNGVVVTFPDNGELPGNAIVRVHSNDSMDNILSDNAYVYFYNEDTNNFCIIAENVKKTEDGYYEFTITHHSQYIMVGTKLDDSIVVNQQEGKVVSFQKSNRTYIVLIIFAIMWITIVALVLVVIKNKRKNKE